MGFWGCGVDGVGGRGFPRVIPGEFVCCKLWLLFGWLLVVGCYLVSCWMCFFWLDFKGKGLNLSQKSLVFGHL